MLEQSVPEGLHPVKRTHTVAVCEELQLAKRTSLEKLMEDCLSWVRPHAGAGEEYEEGGEAETTCDELTVTSIPHLPVQLGGRRS